MKNVLVIEGADFSSVALDKIDILEEKTKITVVASPSGGGVVSGGGLYDEGSTATISATANENYDFSEWSDGNKNATRQISVGSADVTYTAIFVFTGKEEIYKTEEHDGLMNASVGNVVEYSNTTQFPIGTWVYDIPANKIVIIENIITSGSYPFALAKTSDNIVVENMLNNAPELASGTYTFGRQDVPCRLYASRSKLGKVYIKG